MYMYSTSGRLTPLATNGCIHLVRVTDYLLLLSTVCSSVVKSNAVGVNTEDFYGYFETEICALYIHNPTRREAVTIMLQWNTCTCVDHKNNHTYYVYIGLPTHNGV